MRFGFSELFSALRPAGIGLRLLGVRRIEQKGNFRLRGAMVKAVLIVDDSSYVRQALCEFFRCEGDFEVCGEAENGREAIEKAQHLHPDLIVLDLSMPVMDGLNAARVLKALMP